MRTYVGQRVEAKEKLLRASRNGHTKKARWKLMNKKTLVNAQQHPRTFPSTFTSGGACSRSCRAFSRARARSFATDCAVGGAILCFFVTPEAGLPRLVSELAEADDSFESMSCGEALAFAPDSDWLVGLSFLTSSHTPPSKMKDIA